MLSVNFAGADELRAQIPYCQVTGTWVEGLPSVDLTVTGSIGKASVVDGEIPTASEVRNDAGEYIGEITVWVANGYLSAIEYAWVTDNPPLKLPAPSNMKLV